MAFAGFSAKLGKKAVALLEKELREQERKIKLGGAIALTRTAIRAKSEIEIEMLKVFDRPTRYTMNALYVKPARANMPVLEAIVKVKDATLKNNRSVPFTPPVNYLIHQIEGGTRQMKGSEILLQSIGVLPKGHVTVPGDAATMDEFGNMSRGQLVQILSYFRAFRTGGVGYTADSTDETRKKLKKATARRRGRSYFVASQKDRRTRHLFPGIYMKEYSAFGTSTPRPVLMFVKKATYQPRLDFYGVAEKTFAKYIDDELDAAIEFVRKPKGAK